MERTYAKTTARSSLTMSEIIGQQMDACEERLSKMPAVSLFDEDAELFYPQLFIQSYYSSEMKERPDLNDLRLRVITSIIEESMLLCREEYSFLMRVIQENGHCAVQSDDELMACESLIRRLWGKIDAERSEEPEFVLAPPVFEFLGQTLMDKKLFPLRALGFAMCAIADAFVYVSGFMYMRSMIAEINEGFEAKNAHLEERLLVRLLKASFDYCFDSEGEAVLLHQGLAEPEKLLRQSCITKWHKPQMTPEMIASVSHGFLEGEEAACLSLASAIAPFMRPECDLRDAVMDIEIMAKQNFSFEEMKAVLANSVCILPNQSMLSALRRVDMEIVRFTSLKPGVLN